MKPNILVIDDETVTRRLVVYALRPLAIEVLTAQDANEAFEIINKNELSLMLIDINLPDMDGLTLIQTLRQRPALDHVPLVCFTARNDPDDNTRARALGATDFLYKPFSTQELRDLITRYLSI